MSRRIVIDATPLLYKPYGGIGRTTYKLIETLLSLEKNYEFCLFGRRFFGKQFGGFNHKAKMVRLRLPRASEWFIQKVGVIEQLCRADLYHATDFYMPVKRFDKAIATIHDLIFLKQPENMVDHIRLAEWLPDFARKCRHIITISEYTKRDIVEELRIKPEKVSVVYWGVDKRIFSPETDQNELSERLQNILGFSRPYFLAVSCSTGRKNTLFLLEAYKTLVKDDPKNDMVLIWNPSPEVRHQYDTKMFSKRIHFIAYQSDQNLRDLYRGATALVFPSLYEGFGLPILEAMSCGTPVITSEVTSLPEIGGDAPIYIDPTDTGSLLSALSSFENREIDFETIRRRSLKQAEKFSWEKCAMETLEVYEHCLAR